MTKQEFMIKMTNGLYTGDETGSTGFNAKYALRNYILKAIEKSVQTNTDFKNWYDNEFINYTRSITDRYISSDEFLYIGRINDKAPCIQINWSDVYETLSK